MKNSAFADFVVEQMAGLGGVEARRMFGACGVFRAGVMFALIADDMLYFKTDAVNVSRFQARGLGPFTYEAKGEKKSFSYFQAPSEVFDEVQAMTEWGRDAFECALRNQKPKTAKPRPPAARTKAR